MILSSESERPVRLNICAETDSIPHDIDINTVASVAILNAVSSTLLHRLAHHPHQINLPR